MREQYSASTTHVLFSRQREGVTEARVGEEGLQRQGVDTTHNNANVATVAPALGGIKGDSRGGSFKLN